MSFAILSLSTFCVITFSQTIKDWHLLVFIAVLVIVDLVILITYTIVISVNGELSASKNENVEHPSEEKGVSFHIDDWVALYWNCKLGGAFKPPQIIF